MKRINLAIVAALCLLLTLSACSSAASVDPACRERIAGDYQVTGLEDNYWHLYISPEKDRNLFSIYDNAAGNPGVEGEMVLLDDSHIKLKYDKDLYEALPSDEWQLSGDYLEMTYSLEDDRLTLTNNDVSLVFVWEESIELY